MRYSRHRSLPWLLILLMAMTTMGLKCDSGTLFQTIGNRLAAPVAIGVDTARSRAYVVNSNNNVEFTSATLSVLDITDPVAPVLLSQASTPIPIPNFSGQIYLDTTNLTAYIPSRESTNEADTTDTLLKVNVDEASSTFGAVDEFATAQNPFGIACCDPNGRLYVVNSAGSLNVYDPATLIDSQATSVQLSLSAILSSNLQLSGLNSTEVALSGAQAFVSNRAGNIYVMNTDEVGDTTKNPIDYVLTATGDFRGIATDGTFLYVVDALSSAPVLRVIPLSAVPPVVSDTSSIPEVVINDGHQVASIALGHNPNEVVLFQGQAYVSNRDDDTVSVIDLSGYTAKTVSVGDQPFGLSAFSSGNSSYLYVTHLLSNSISIVDITPGSSTINTVVGTFQP